VSVLYQKRVDIKSSRPPMHKGCGQS